MGKTTLLKLKTRELLRSCVDVCRKFYWACDQVEGQYELYTVISPIL